jgi:hypothetical protein
VECDRDRLRALEHALRLAQAVLERMDAVDDDAALTQFGLELRHDVHAVLGYVLERRIADRHRRVQRDEIDGRDVVQLRVGHPAAAELRRGARRRDTARDAARRVPVAERREARDVLAHRQHPGDAIARLGELRVWLEVLRDMHDATAVHAREEGDAPRPQDVDEHLVPRGLDPWRGPLALFALDRHCHFASPLSSRK